MVYLLDAAASTEFEPISSRPIPYMARSGSIPLAAYTAIGVFVLFPTIDIAAAVLPAGPADMSWRFGAAGIVSRILPMLVLGLLLALFVAISLDHPRIRRGLGVASFLLAMVLVIIWLVFLVDSTRMGAQMAGPARSALESAAVVALVKYALASLSALLIARAALDPRA
jgi:hypothetical protein